MNRISCLFVIALMTASLATPIAFARRAEVTKTDGTTIIGEVVEETDKSIVLKIAGIDTTIGRNLIKGVKFLKTVEETYQEKRDALKDSDSEGRYKLAQEMFDEKAYHLALKELDSLIGSFPDVKKYKLLRDLVAQRMEKSTVIKPPVKVDNPPRDNGGTTTRPPTKKPNSIPDGIKLPTKKLTMEDVNRIRIYEVDFRDRKKPNVKIPREVIDDFFEKYREFDSVPKSRTDQTKFRKQPGWQQLQAVMSLADHGARDYYGDITVRDDPPAFRTFKMQIHARYVINYCATAGCHGGPQGWRIFPF